MMKCFKKITALLSATALAATVITGCAGNSNSTSSGSKESSSETSSEAETTSTNPDADVDLKAIGSKEFCTLLGNGTNLGNTMEAYGHKEGVDKETSFYETLWGNPVTTQETIDYMKEAGLTTLRIPVAWTNMMDFENGDYTINEAYLARVKEIVDYAYNDEMYVIINDHWDGGWWGMYGSADKAKRKSAEDLYESMWTQISEYFQDYDYHLIFEGGNEEIGDRLNDLDEDFNPDGGTLEISETYEKSNEINQKFVDIVRGTGGNNPDRFLLIPGYSTDITKCSDDAWKMPTDTAEDKLILSVHYYTPWSFCGGESDEHWGTKQNYEEMNNLMETLSKIEEGKYGVIIGECAVGPLKDGSIKPDAMKWYENLYANCDYYGYVPLLWDNGNQMDRETGEWISEDLKNFFISKSRTEEASKTEDEVKNEAKEYMDKALSDAPKTFKEDSEVVDVSDGNAVAWIMWNSGDWALNYSVGDEYAPDSCSAGITPTDVEITGEGTYTVALDFTGTDGGCSNSTAFSAIGIANGEDIFPGYTIDIKSVKVNGEEYKLDGKPYTTSDDKHCTRVNLYNSWVTGIPDDAHTVDGDVSSVSPTVITPEKLGDVET
ncbi:MAG: glycoside hydrolase family 5 protein, partial [Lachnospiraceae bacterium]|nr:glycoside hydrolase family 5 protein [Lachnospiraceae bacterium]